MAKDVIADFGNGWYLTQKDLDYSHYRHEYERRFVGLKNNVLDDPSLFHVFIYSSLSAAQNTERLMYTFNKLRMYKLDTPERILEEDNRGKIESILKRTRFPNVKIRRFLGLAEWWSNSPKRDLIGMLIDDINSGGEKTIYLRNRLVEDGPEGIGHKISSLIVQIATEDIRDVKVVTVDRWVLQFLKDMGIKIKTGNKYKDVKVPDYRTVSGVSNEEYLECERVVSEMAEDCNLGPGEFGQALWCKAAYVEPIKSLYDFL